MNSSMLGLDKSQTRVSKLLTDTPTVASSAMRFPVSVLDALPLPNQLLTTTRFTM